MSSALDLLTDACADLVFSARKMFGGHGFFAPNGGMFAGIVTDDQIIFKLADEKARAELVAAGGHPWVYTGQKSPMTMAQWIVVPERFYDDQELFSGWAKRAHALVPAKVVKVPAKKRTPPPVAKKKTSPVAKTKQKRAAKKARATR
jgi:TfoX/Sxy family transcriptional regulator of competence genes